MTDPTLENLRIYRIIRFRKSGRRRVIHKNVTLAVWFDGYDYMPGCRPVQS